jgi:hypothetical protein
MALGIISWVNWVGYVNKGELDFSKKAIWASMPGFAMAAEAQRDTRTAAVAASIWGRNRPSLVLDPRTAGYLFMRRRWRNLEKLGY